MMRIRKVVDAGSCQPVGSPRTTGAQLKAAISSTRSPSVQERQYEEEIALPPR